MKEGPEPDRAGPLQRHDTRFHERNLFVLALLGLLSRARAARRSILQHCSSLPEGAASIHEETSRPPRSLLLALGIISLGRTLEHHLAELAAQGRVQLPGQAAPEAPRRAALRELLR